MQDIFRRENSAQYQADQSILQDQIEPLDPIQTQEQKWFNPFLSTLNFFLEIIQVLIIVGVLSFVIRMFIVQPFYIIGTSMEPYLYEKQLLMIDELSYRFVDPKRGDIVVIDPPRDTRDYIKRIIALPGEKITIDDQGQVLINNQVLYETYLGSENQYTKGQLELTLGEDEYFVMGDNRRVSNDSRGSISQKTNEAVDPWTVSEKNIIGKAFLRWWPLDQLSFIQRPVYPF